MKVDELVDEIIKTKELVDIDRVSEMDPNLLINIFTKLAILKVSLGRFIVYLEAQSSLMENTRRIDEFNEYRRLIEQKTSATSANEYSKGKFLEEKRKEIEIKSQTNTLAILRQDISDLIGTLRSALSYMKKEREEL